MFPVDALPAAYIEEREAEIREARARKAEMERAARAFALANPQAAQSACNTPVSSPNVGFFAGFLSAWTRSADTTPVSMSRSSSASGCGAANNNNSTTKK